MIEMRWVQFDDGVELQYRYYAPTVDASGSLTPFGNWSEWTPVKMFTLGDSANYKFTGIEIKNVSDVPTVKEE